MPPSIRQRDVRVPKLLNAIKKGRKGLLPLLPYAIENLPLADYDLLISTSSCVAKGAVKGAKGRHLCYLHSPMRYIWDQQDEYLQGVAHIPLAQSLIKALTPRLRRWDVESSSRVDRFIANSSFVAERAKRLYGSEAGVVHPPIELERFRPLGRRGREGYLLAAGAFVSYKRFDLAIEAAQITGRRLIVAGNGPMLRQLKKQAKAEVHFEVAPADERFADLLAGADALLFPGVEDFGMTAIEAMAAGTPVIAFAEGGARDFIVPGVTGTFFNEPTVEALAAAIREHKIESYDVDALIKFAKGFGPEGFLVKMKQEIAQLLSKDAG